MKDGESHYHAAFEGVIGGDGVGSLAGGEMKEVDLSALVLVLRYG